VPHGWQKIEGRWHLCHSWQDVARAIVTAIPREDHHRERELVMSVLALVASAVVVALVVAYIVSSLKRVIDEDGAHDSRRNPPRSHYSDPFDPRSRLA
jgi:hypothetical protein